READVAARLDRERVPHPLTGRVVDQLPTQWDEARLDRDAAGRDDGKPPQPRGDRLRHVDGVSSGRKTDAVGPFEREDHLADLRARRRGVVEAAEVAVALARP